MVDNRYIRIEQFENVTATRLIIDNSTGLFRIEGEGWRMSLHPHKPRYLWNFRHVYGLVEGLPIANVWRHANTERTRYTFIVDGGYYVDVNFADWEDKDNIAQVKEVFETW